jgi:hypothetical protein
MGQKLVCLRFHRDGAFLERPELWRVTYARGAFGWPPNRRAFFWPFEALLCVLHLKATAGASHVGQCSTRKQRNPGLFVNRGRAEITLDVARERELATRQLDGDFDLFLA